ncbi:MAG: ABC transporter permease, partial [Bacteroidota bacterium]
MLRNFLKTTFRNILKTGGYFAINLIGLALSLACCITAYLNYKYSANFDKQHANYHRIQKVQINKSIEGAEMPFGMVPLPLGHAVQGELSEVEFSVRFHPSGRVIKKDEKTFNKRVGFADPDFFQVFTFPFKSGSPNAFGEQGNIILTENAAAVYFGDQDPMG